MTDSNPYAAPRSDSLAGPAAGYAPVRVLSLRGRLGRLRFIAYQFAILGLGYLLAGLLVMLVMGVAGPQGLRYDLSPVVQLGLVVLMAAATLLTGIVTVQRLHDFNASGLWALLLLLPLANLLLYLALTLMPGSDGANRFGAPPPPNTAGVKLLVLLYLALAVATLLFTLFSPVTWRFQ